MLERKCKCGCIKVNGLVCRSQAFPKDLCNHETKGSQVMNKLILNNQSIFIKSMDAVEFDVTANQVITMKCTKCNSTFKIMEKNKKCFLYMKSDKKNVVHRSSFDDCKTGIVKKFVNNYIVTDYEKADEEVNIDVPYQNSICDYDYDFNLMFSNDKEPFVGSFVDHFMATEYSNSF